MSQEEISKLQQENESLKAEIKSMRDEHEKNKEDLMVFYALKAAGVDNWDGYDLALDMLEG